MNKLWTAITEALASGAVTGMTFAQGTITLDLADPRETAEPKEPAKRTRKPRAPRNTGDKIITGLKEAIEHAKGQPETKSGADDLGDIPEGFRRT